MTLTDLIASARGALGGIDRLRGVRSYHAVARRVTASGRASTVAVWRAAGGRIRVEEQSSGGRTVRIANGSNASPDVDALVRTARIAPRNLLAHADEYSLTLRDHPASDGSLIVSFPAEFILYCFHPTTFYCTRLIDLTRDCRTAFNNYRVVDGIATPFLERHSLAEPREGFEDIYQHVAYNLNLPDDLFS
jgi:hypothetical protein